MTANSSPSGGVRYPSPKSGYTGGTPSTSRKLRLCAFVAGTAWAAGGRGREETVDDDQAALQATFSLNADEDLYAAENDTVYEASTPRKVFNKDTVLLLFH